LSDDDENDERGRMMTTDSSPQVYC
jgi:hypothetical protein